uniref:Uncharacterized protein n=1 Tax=Arion vulgaris TaxID=1028688 RepID=A0A0B7BBP5_9EUPU
MNISSYITGSIIKSLIMTIYLPRMFNAYLWQPPYDGLNGVAWTCHLYVSTNAIS